MQLRSESFRLVLEPGVEQHNPFRGRQRIHGCFGIADRVDVVEQPGGLEVGRIVVLRARISGDAEEVVRKGEEGVVARQRLAALMWASDWVVRLGRLPTLRVDANRGRND